MQKLAGKTHPEVPPVPSRANTMAAVVLFHPEGDLLSRLERVLGQVAGLVVVSNDGESAQRLAELDATRVTCLQNATNLGLALGLNQALAHASQAGYRWCLLLDQDTLVDLDLVEGLSAVYTAHPQPHKIGLLAPNYRSPGGSRTAYPTEATWQTLETAVTSGSLLFIDAVKQVGGMREAFFIEGIDIEFSLRLRAAGLQLVASGRPLMTHGAGAAEERRLFGRTVLVGHHSPWRCFMQFRNLTWTLWRYRRLEPHWTRTALVSMLKRYCIVFLFERQRLRKVWAMLRGTFVGFAQALHTDKESGKLPAVK